MANIDESNQDRETYGNPPGWSQDKMTSVAPESPAGAPGASPPPDAPADSSSEEVQGDQSQEQVPPQAQPEPEKKFNLPPPERWEELRQQRMAAEQRAQQAEQLAQLALQKLQTPSAASVQEDPWAGLVNHPDASTAQQYQMLQKLFQHEAAKQYAQQSQPVMQALDMGRQELAALRTAQFRKENPEIVPGSQEEQVLASYISAGLDPDSAKKLVLFDKLKAENQTLKSKAATIPQKRMANTESSGGIPQTAGLPGKQGDWRDKVAEIHDKGGDWQDMANAVFGGKRR